MTYEALTKAGVPLFAYGNFITVLLNFLILAFIIFLMVKQINRLRRPTPPPAAGDRRKTSSCCARSATRCGADGGRAGAAPSARPSVTQCRVEARSLAPY